ncbi:MAG: Nre family DNA repair protein [Candidatus Micrarchaeaceae archaeon]
MGSENPSVKRSDIVYRHMRDPALLRYYYRVKMLPLTNRMDIVGSSPTDLFIGRFGYPYVNIGPLVPPEFGDTTILSTPERWHNMGIEEIVGMRSKMVRGLYRTKVQNVEHGRVEELVRDLAIAERPAEAEVSFASRPFVKLTLKDEVEPFGPSARMRKFELYNMHADRSVERLYSDTDAPSKTAMIELYEKGIPVSKIQKGLSAGIFGIGTRRRFVPTRWSITAVDDTLSKDNLEEVKSYDTVDSIYAYYNNALDNRWLIFFVPGNWQYESIEAWYPKTVWNEDGVNISIFGSYENYNGRKTYAEIGGCYYSGRLAITEKMQLIKRQAVALILREVHDGYIMPVGVWNVREHVRETLQNEPHILHSMSDMLWLIRAKLDIKAEDWIRNSTVLRDMIQQRRLREYSSYTGRPSST